MATKEDKYIEQLKAMGVWEDAFYGTVHDLAVLEREQHRARAAWKATAEEGKAPSPLDPHYALILQQGRDIQKLREALGLTPKALRRVKGSYCDTSRVSALGSQGSSPYGDISSGPTVLDFVREKYGA